VQPANREPLELALDTMGILSEPVFFRYIRDKGGISLTPMEFREFLGYANERRELFMLDLPIPYLKTLLTKTNSYEPFPGSGVVLRIDAGWTKTQTQTFPLPSLSSEPEQELMGFLDNLMTDVATREELYEYSGEGRDLDTETFQKWLIYRDNDEFEIPVEEFRDVVYGMVREGVDYFTLGPEGIVMFMFGVGGLREEFADRFTKERMRWKTEWKEKTKEKSGEVM
jgi:hypothetical protein